ncbi:MAG: aminotransferase class IV [Anaerolineae bacterium]|nr:aminotransferase class IV [Anaerolineae bacterium]
MSDLICYVNGEFIPLNEGKLSVQDLAILRGYGVFDFLRTYNGKPFRLPAHLHRLQCSAQAIGLALPHPLDRLETIVLDTLGRNSLPEANIRIVVTGGPAPDAITPAAQPGLIVIVAPVHRYPAAYYDQGIKVITVETDRYLPRAKTINYIPAIIALNQARAAGAVEALYTNAEGHILEGTTTNFFVIHGSQLITPKDDILPGVTRDIILALAEDNDFEIIERPLTRADVELANEAFITASNKEIMPVRQVDDIIIGQSTSGPIPGPNTQHLMNKYKALLAAELG